MDSESQSVPFQILAKLFGLHWKGICGEPCHIAVHIALLVDGQVVCSTHIVGCMDGLGTKTQVADGHTAALLGIILKVGLAVLENYTLSNALEKNHVKNTYKIYRESKC